MNICLLKYNLRYNLDLYKYDYNIINIGKELLKIKNKKYSLSKGSNPPPYAWEKRQSVPLLYGISNVHNIHKLIYVWNISNLFLSGTDLVFVNIMDLEVPVSDSIPLGNYRLTCWWIVNTFTGL